MFAYFRPALRVLALSLLAFPLFVPAPGVAGEAPWSEKEIALREHLEKLDRHYRELLEDAELAVAEDRLDSAELEREVERARRHLHSLERHVPRDPNDRELWLDRLEALGRRLDALERAAEWSPEEAAARLETRRARARTTSGIAPRAGGMSPANDECISASAIGLGIVSGDTANATPNGVASCGYSELSPDVWFRFTPPTSGTYHASTFGSDYDTVLSVYESCPNLGDDALTCSDNSVGLQSSLSFDAYAEEDVWIRLSGFAGSAGAFSLELGIGASISGRVIDAATGEPLPLIDVRVDPGIGFPDHVTETDADGSYRVAGLAPGEYHVFVEAQDNFLAQPYDGISCPLGPCYPSDGDAIHLGATADVSGIDFALERAGTLSGRLVDAGSGAPVIRAEVELRNLHGHTRKYVYSDADGNYSFGGLPTGQYLVYVYAGGYLPRYYGGKECDPYYDRPPCDPDEATPVSVTAGQVSGGIDLAMERGGTISGRVTESLTGEPSAFAEIDLYDPEGKLLFDSYALTDADGHYRGPGLHPGAYVVVAEPYRFLVDYYPEAYDDVVCAGDVDCYSEGTAVVVEKREEISGIDIAFERKGSISGRVIDAETGNPLARVDLELYDENGVLFDYTHTRPDGTYSLKRVELGAYNLIVKPGIEWLPEVYPEGPCPLVDGEPNCDPATGELIEVGLNSEIGGIDFALQPSGLSPPVPGEISGVVRSAATGEPISDVHLTLYRATGEIVASGHSDEAGAYDFEDLEPGSYAVLAQAEPPYLSQLHGGPFCSTYDSPGCGSPADHPLDLGEGQTLQNVDFALPLGATISGRVVAAASLQPIYGMRFELRSSTGEFITSAQTDNDGRFRIVGLPGGSYRGLVESDRGYSGEVWAGLPCPGPEACDPTHGLPIVVEVGEVLDDVDFALHGLGSISGEVIDAGTDAGIETGSAVLWNSRGEMFEMAHLSSGGRFTFSELPPGSYFLGTDARSAHVDELYGGVECAFAACDPTRGMPVVIDFESEVTGLKLELGRGSSLSGLVIDLFRDGVAAEYADVELWSETGEYLSEIPADEFGRYLLMGLPAGRYYLRAHGYQYIDRLYGGVDCEGETLETCDLEAATPIEVPALPTALSDLDFELAPDPGAKCNDDDDDDLCLNQGRFLVYVDWKDFEGDGNYGRGEYLTGDAGYFTFADEDNIEVLVKVVDACTAPYDRYWIFAAGLTNLEVEITVYDTLAEESKTYGSELGEPFQPVIDTEGFSTCLAFDRSGARKRSNPVDAIARAWERFAELYGLGKAEGDCTLGSGQLCLESERFEVSAIYETFDGTTGSGRAMPLTPNAGYFWFFEPENVEVVVKVLDACVEPYDRYWVFAAGLTNLGVDLRVVDTVTGEERIYPNPVGRPFAPVVDTQSFDVCP